MRRLVPVSILALAAACGAAERASRCTISTDCPVGQACVAAEGERVCWADATPPRTSGVVASCGTDPCLRDGTLHVEATVTDDREVLDASVRVSLDPSRSFPMSRASGETWVADVPLRELPLAAVEGTVTPTVTARDGARTASVPVDGSAVGVTRVKAAIVLGAAGFNPSPAALLEDGTVVIGGPTAKIYFVKPDGSVSSLAVGMGQFAMGTPAVGTRAIWVGSEDGWLYGVKLDGTGKLTDVGVNTQGAVKGGVAVQARSDKEIGFAAGAGGRLGAATTVALERAVTVAEDSYTVGPVLDRQGRAFSTTAASSADATRRCYPFDGLSFGNSCGTAPVGVTVTAPLAVDGDDHVWTASQDRKLFKTGTADAVATLPAVILDSPVILSGGDIVVGDQSGLLHRYTSVGASVWTTEPNLGAPVLAPLVLRGAEAVLIVPTRTGKVAALRADGSKVWEATLGPGELRTGNVYTPPGQPAGHVVSTVYFPSTDGQLHALLVDGELDTAAPWPKAFHDARNTNNAGTLP
jgi:hypothetical protein